MVKMTPTMQIRFELNMLGHYLVGATPKADAVRYWKATNPKRAELFRFELDGYYKVGRRRIAKAKATRQQMGKKLATRFGKKLRKLRRDRDMSRKELAKASGVSKGSVRDYEQGNQKLSFKKGVKLASALGVSCDELAGVVVKKPKKS